MTIYGAVEVSDQLYSLATLPLGNESHRKVGESQGQSAPAGNWTAIPWSSSPLSITIPIKLSRLQLIRKISEVYMSIEIKNKMSQKKSWIFTNMMEYFTHFRKASGIYLYEY
jgi:hypothetical protein